ncbi:MAG: hypothetical protein AB1458_01180 [Bacteroidota bacterium]
MKVGNKFTVSIPASLVPLSDTALRADLYYVDTLRNMAFIVVAESKDTMGKYGLNYTASKYFDKTSKSLMEKLQDAAMNIFYPDTINGCAAMTGKIYGDVQDDKLFYQLTVVETGKNFYQLIWAMEESSATRQSKMMERTVDSFRELAP